MHHALVTAALAPLLLWQGRQVRRVTPRLPEAEGPRTGSAGQGPLLRLLVLGDSAAAGVGVPSQQEALTGCLLDELAPQRRVHWRLLAHSGDDLAQVARRLPVLDGVAYDVAVLSIGVNDVTGRTPPARWVRGYSELLARLRRDHGVRLSVLTPVPPMHLFPALPQPLRWYLGQGARRLNRALRTLADGTRGCALLQAPFPLDDPGLMASDGFHPGARANLLWAQAAAAAIHGYHGTCTSVPDLP